MECTGPGEGPQAPLSIPFPSPDLVPESMQNRVIKSHIFRLKPGAQDRFDRKNWVVLKEFVAEVLSEEFAVQQRNSARNVYISMPLQYFNEHDVLHKSYEAEYYQFQQTKTFQDDQHGWFNAYEPGELVYQGFSIERSVGCSHDIQLCELQCHKCGRFYSCRRCHDGAVSDHTFPKEETEVVRCKICRQEQPFGLTCRHCGTTFGLVSCAICRFISYIPRDAKPFYHCDKCNYCNVGSRETSIHCDTCGICYNQHYYPTHTCREIGDCPVCLTDMKRCKHPITYLNCGHQLHQACYEQLLDSNVLQCPLCRRFMPVDSDYEMVNEALEKRYRRTMNYPNEPLITVQCCECGWQFPQYRSSATGIYYCPKCKLFNCQEIQCKHTEQDYCQFCEDYPDTIPQVKFDPMLIFNTICQKYKDIGTIQQLMIIIMIQAHANEFCALYNRGLPQKKTSFINILQAIQGRTFNQIMEEIEEEEEEERDNDDH